MQELTKQQLLKIRAEAKDVDEKARKIFQQEIAGPWELTKLSAEVKKKELWKYMSTTYDKWETWAVDVGMKRSTAFQRNRIYNALQPFVPWKELKKISFENSDWLAKLPEDDRKNPDIWKKAQTMKEDDFMQVVQERQRANGQAVSDGRVNLKIRCYSEQSTFIQSVIKRFAEENNLGDDYGRSLEMICAEVQAQLKDGSSFVEKIRQTVLTAAFEATQTKTILDTMRSEFEGKNNKSGDEILLATANHINELEDALAKVVSVLAAGTKNFGQGNKPQGALPMPGGASGAEKAKSKSAVASGPQLIQ